MNNNSVTHTLVVASVLCIVCSIAVSSASVGLKPIQEQNKALDKKKNILMAAGLISGQEKSREINRIFNEKIKAQLIELPSCEPSNKFDPLTFDERKAAKDPNLSVEIAPDKDLARIRRRSRYAVVYYVYDQDQLQQVVLPIYGKGLWSTMYGYLAVSSDGKTVQGIGYYEHGETPGLGGEVDNPKWKAQWRGKKIFDEMGQLKIQVLKGKVDMDRPDAAFQIDGLAGATLTTRGVHYMIQYWLGDDGFASLLRKLSENYGSGGQRDE